MRVHADGQTFTQEVIGTEGHERVVGVTVTHRDRGGVEYRYFDGAVLFYRTASLRLGYVELVDVDLWGGRPNWIVRAKRAKKGSNTRTSRFEGDYGKAFKKYLAVKRECEEA